MLPGAGSRAISKSVADVALASRFRVRTRSSRPSTTAASDLEISQPVKGVRARSPTPEAKVATDLEIAQAPGPASSSGA